jgi:tungstate transport system permease protein
MEVIWEGIKEAFLLIISGDPEIWAITWLTLQVSGTAIAISLVIGLPLGTWLAMRRFSGRGCLFSFINTGMAFPPVVIGLWVSIFLWRSGPLGNLGLIYTPAAMVIAQTIIAAPIVIGLTIAALQQLNPYLRLQLLGLGASRLQVTFALWREARLPLLAALMAGFGSIISEVGASMMVGGNIKGQTRVLTTAIVLETSKGQFTIAIALGLILLLIAFLVNYLLTSFQQKGTQHKEIQ